MTWLFLPVVVLALLHYAVAIHHYGLLTPDGIFVLTQLLMVYGTLRLVNPAVPAEVFYARLMIGAVALYLVTSSITYLWHQNAHRATQVPEGRPTYAVVPIAPTAAVVSVIALSAVITVLYFVSVGYSAFLLGLKGQLSGDPLNVSLLRINSYAGSKYLFPGYVNQFKNVLLPALLVVLITWLYPRTRGALRATVIVTAAIPAVFALLGTGQRGAFLLFVLTVLVYVSLCNHGRLSRKALLVPLCGLLIGILATYALGRNTGGPGGPLNLATAGMYQRFVNDNQLAGIAAFDYTSMFPTQHGHEWLTALAGILPGNRGSTLSNQVFATLYGSTVGTAPPSLWGSVHYNFGTIGVIVAAILLGIILQTITSRSMRHPTYNTLQLIGYAGMTVILGTWAAGSPDALLNGGLAAYFGLWCWGVLVRRSRPPGTAAPAPPAGRTGSSDSADTVTETAGGSRVR